MSTLKVDTINTSDGTGNITVSRPLSGSGASLTNLPAANLTGTLPAMSGANFLILPPLFAKTMLKKLYQKLGNFRYSVFIILILFAMSLPIKMYLRWLFNLKYIIAIPEYFFNI